MSAVTPRSQVIRRLRHELGIDADNVGARDGQKAIASTVSLVRGYISDYTGAAFNSFGEDDPYSITSDDLIAVTTLSIAIDEYSSASIRPTAIQALWKVRDKASVHLRGLPVDQDLHQLTAEQFDEWLGNDNSPGSQLYELLRGQVSFPRVATHKLLARKRPRLFPIRDSVVEEALDLHRQDLWWRPWWEALRLDPTIVDRLEVIRRQANVADLSLLRVADIVIWLQNR